MSEIQSLRDLRPGDVGKRIMQDTARQAVTPGALAARLLCMDGVEWSWPTRA